MRENKYQWITLWTVIMGEGSIDVPILKKTWSLYSELDGRKMDVDTYLKAMHTHKMLTRAINQLEDSKELSVKRDRRGRATEIRITSKGLDRILPHNEEGPLGYETYPETIHIYNEDGTHNYSLLKDTQPTNYQNPVKVP